MKKKLLGLDIPREQVEKLLRDKKTDLLKGFTSNKTKRKFDAFLVLRSSGKLAWEFPPREPKPKAEKKPSAKRKLIKKPTKNENSDFEVG